MYESSATLPAPAGTRDAILDATDRIMQRYGFRKMTMDDVAREAGVSKRTIYTYFSGKPELGLSSIERVVLFAQSQMAQAAEAEGDVSTRLQNVLVARVMARVLSVRDYHQSLDELFEAVRPAYMERRKRNFAAETSMIENLIREGLACGEFHADSPREQAELLLRATNAFLPYSLSVTELGDPESIRHGVGEMARLLIRGLRAQTEEKP